MLINIDDVLRNHIEYHHSSRNGVGPNYIVESVLGPEKATNRGSIFNLVLSYLMERISINDTPILSSLLMYVKYHGHDNDIFIPRHFKDIC